MERQRQMVELSDHVKHRLGRYRSSRSPEESSDSPSTEYEQGESRHVTSADEQQRDFERTSPPYESYLSSKHATNYESRSYLANKYEKQRGCRDCARRHHLLQVEHERLQKLYHENRRLQEELRSLLSRCRHYKEENYRLKDHLIKLNVNLYQYQSNLDQLKEEMQAEKKPAPKILVENDANDEERRLEHLKRLRYELEMYHRLAMAKEKQEEKRIRRKPIDFPF